MQPFAFCELASRLIANETSPEGFRTAISRAYYGAFLEAEAFLARMSVSLPSRESKHQQLINVLAHSGDADVDEASAMLGDLREQRNRADYRLDNRDVETQPHAVECLKTARHIVGKLNGCRISTTRFTAVTEKIQAEVRRLRGH